MNDKNNWIFVNIFGRLTKDPIIKTFGQNAMKVVEFSVAVSNRKNVGYSSLNCALFGPAAEEAGRTLQKGTFVFVTGRLELYKFKDRNGDDRDANKVYVSEYFSAGQANCGQIKPAPETIHDTRVAFANSAIEDQSENELPDETASEQPEIM